MTFKFECEDNTALTPTWTGTSYTAGSDPSFIYKVNSNSGASSTAISRTLTTIGNKRECDSRLLTTIQMIKNGNWVDIVEEDAGSPTSDKPGWLTTASVSDNVASFIVNTADFTAFDDNL